MAEFVLGLKPRSRVTVEGTNQNLTLLVPLSGGVDHPEAPVPNVHLLGHSSLPALGASPASAPARIAT